MNVTHISLLSSYTRQHGALLLDTVAGMTQKRKLDVLWCMAAEPKQCDWMTHERYMIGEQEPWLQK